MKDAKGLRSQAAGSAGTEFTKMAISTPDSASPLIAPGTLAVEPFNSEYSHSAPPVVARSDAAELDQNVALAAIKADLKPRLEVSAGMDVHAGASAGYERDR